MLFSTLVLSIEAVFTPYMGVHFWDFTTEELSLLPLAALCGLLLSLPLTPLVTKLLDKNSRSFFRRNRNRQQQRADRAAAHGSVVVSEQRIASDVAARDGGDVHRRVDRRLSLPV
jgi:hypothetical protein